MRDGWTETTLNTVLLPVLTRARDNSEYEVLSVTEKRGIIPQTEIFNHRIATDDISKYKVLQPGDIAFNPYLLWCGAVGQWKGNYEGVVSPVYECFRVRETDSPRFVGLIFESGVLTPYFDSTAIGSIVRRRRTTLPVFYEAPILRPPLAEQKRIVDVVSSVDSYIDALQQQADTARKARNAVLHGLLEDVADSPIRKLKDLTSKIGSGATPRGGESVYQKSGVTLIRSQNVHNALFLHEGLVAIDDSAAAALDGVSVEVNDVLINITGASVARTCLVDEMILPARVNQHVAILRTDSKVLLPGFLLRVLLGQQMNSYLLGISGSGTTRQAITKAQLESLEMAVPPISEQKRIVEVMSSMDEVIRATEQAVVDAKNLRSGLLSDLLSGEHEIPASYDLLLGAA